MCDTLNTFADVETIIFHKLNLIQDWLFLVSKKPMEMIAETKTNHAIPVIINAARCCTVCGISTPVLPVKHRLRWKELSIDHGVSTVSLNFLHDIAHGDE